jgi:hypothetical protein
VSGPLGVAIVGCGDVSRHYAEDLVTYPALELRGVSDLLPERAREAAARHGLHAYDGIDELLSDQRVVIVVNLTVAAAHAEVTSAALRAGKHVFSEKPLALEPAAARELLALASECDRRLGCAPIVPLGELAISARRFLAEGKLGTVRLAYADVNWGRVEAWHQRPQPQRLFARRAGAGRRHGRPEHESRARRRSEYLVPRRERCIRRPDRYGDRRPRTSPSTYSRGDTKRMQSRRLGTVERTCTDGRPGGAMQQGQPSDVWLSEVA